MDAVSKTNHTLAGLQVAVIYAPKLPRHDRPIWPQPLQRRIPVTHEAGQQSNAKSRVECHVPDRHPGCGTSGHHGDPEFQQLNADCSMGLEEPGDVALGRYLPCKAADTAAACAQMPFRRRPGYVRPRALPGFVYAYRSNDWRSRPQPMPLRLSHAGSHRAARPHANVAHYRSAATWRIAMKHAALKPTVMPPMPAAALVLASVTPRRLPKRTSTTGYVDSYAFSKRSFSCFPDTCRITASINAYAECVARCLANQNTSSSASSSIAVTTSSRASGIAS